MVVIEPPPETPSSALTLAEVDLTFLSRCAGVPDSIINTVTTQKNVQEIGCEMCESKVVQKVSFTGPMPVAKPLYSTSASTLKKSALPLLCLWILLTDLMERISIEASGNSPFIVFDDADIEKAVEGTILCKIPQIGTDLCRANCIYVQSSIHAGFASQLAERVAAFKVGNRLDETTYICSAPTHGLLIHNHAVSKVVRHVDNTIALGASVLIGGHSPDTTQTKHIGSFYPPTILSDVPTTVMLNRKETFGPIAALIKFDTEE
ncbi:aldehyde dehydrogenase domain-containing protein [Boletus reticuloceps]|uniref:Aldehyde dehydrogenase domain-containing protein n=1 Tax=Boletus reticuloceps TaxID=495285 RepID=A0A8I3ADH1_9AGAM|nr:aldehyde dehydrogenase domain-containing protein [Boletus reticuloceps]